MYKIKLLKIPGQNDKNYQKSREFFYYSAPMGRGTIEDGGGGIISRPF